MSRKRTAAKEVCSAALPSRRRSTQLATDLLLLVKGLTTDACTGHAPQPRPAAAVQLPGFICSAPGAQFCMPGMETPAHCRCSYCRVGLQQKRTCLKCSVQAGRTSNADLCFAQGNARMRCPQRAAVVAPIPAHAHNQVPVSVHVCHRNLQHMAAASLKCQLCSPARLQSLRTFATTTRSIPHAAHGIVRLLPLCKCGKASAERIP